MLRVLADRTTALAAERGDTEWSDDDRVRIATAYEAVRAVGPPLRRYSAEDDL